MIRMTFTIAASHGGSFQKHADLPFVPAVGVMVGVDGSFREVTRVWVDGRGEITVDLVANANDNELLLKSKGWSQI